ncbi:MAG: hypothetical protein ACFWUA_05175 [Sporanaerobacter sp.]|jgi:hypothetical protein
MQEQRERIKRYIYLILLSNIAIAGFQPFIQNIIIKIILAIYTMLTMLFTIIYVKEKKC